MYHAFEGTERRPPGAARRRRGTAKHQGIFTSSDAPCVARVQLLGRSQ